MIKPDQLFRGVELDPSQITIPPGTSRIGHYVLEQFLEDNQVVREREEGFKWLSEQHLPVLEKGRSEISDNDDAEQAWFNQLDLLFILGSYLPQGSHLRKDADSYRNTPPILLDMIAENASRFGIPSRMTYELIIDKNSEEFERTGTMRLFMDREYGLTERDFYYGHSLAEPLVYGVYSALKAAINTGDTGERAALLDVAYGTMKDFTARMRGYALIKKDHFGLLRPYLSMYPEGTRNASGAFMPSVQQLELVLHPATRMHSEYARYIDISMPYFPLGSQRAIAEDRKASENGYNFEDMINSGQATLTDDERLKLADVVEQFIQFRCAHLGITASQIKEAFDPKNKIIRRDELKDFGERDIMDDEVAAGTAGFNPQNVLGNAVYRLIKLKERLTSL